MKRDHQCKCQVMDHQRSRLQHTLRGVTYHCTTRIHNGGFGLLNTFRCRILKETHRKRHEENHRKNIMSFAHLNCFCKWWRHLKQLSITGRHCSSHSLDDELRISSCLYLVFWSFWLDFRCLSRIFMSCHYPHFGLFLSCIGVAGFAIFYLV